MAADVETQTNGASTTIEVENAATIEARVAKSWKVNVPWSRLRFPEGFNARTDANDRETVKSLASSIAEHGLLQDVVVVVRTGQDGLPEYPIVAGETRGHALVELAFERGWSPDHQVTVTVRTFDDAHGATFANLAENVKRRELRTADLAKRCHELIEGVCTDPVTGKTLPPIPIASLAFRLGLSAVRVRELVRAWRGASPEVRAAWRQEQIGGDEARAWCRLSEEEQRARLASHVAGKNEETKAQPKKRTEKPKGDSAEEREAHETRERAAPSRAEILAKVEALGAKLDSGSLKGTALAVTRARLEALRWAAGEIKRMPS